MQPDILLSSIALAIALLTAIYVWRRRLTLGAHSMLLLQVVTSLWLIAQIGEITGATHNARLFWLSIQFACAVLVPAAWLLFILQFTGHRTWLTKASALALPVTIIVLLLAIATNPWHHRFIRSSSIDEQSIFLGVQYGPVLNIIHFYFFVLLLGAVFLLLYTWRSGSGLYKRQAFVFLLSITILLVGGLIPYFIPQSLNVNRSLTIGLSLSTLVTAWGIYRFRVLDIVPIARDAVFHSMNDGVIVVDVLNRIIDMNPAAQTVFSCPASNTIGQRLTQVIPELGEYPIPAQSAQARHYEISLHTDGQERWFDLRISPLLDAHQRLNGHVLLLHDATQSRHIRDSLIDARDAAEEATRIRSDFIANVTHEIRTPMNAVIAMTSMLLETDLSGEQQDYVDTIRTCGEMLVGLVNSVLDFSKIESGNLELETKPFALDRCIEQTLDLFAAQAAKKNIELIYYLSDSSPSIIRGDAMRLRQILINLVGNAMKFTHEGEISVWVTSQRVGDAHRFHFQIRDTGVGIPEDRIHRLFQSFSQVDASIAREYGGSGLGLAISRGLIEQMGGTIWVESEVTVGSTFHFTILVVSDRDGTAPTTTIGFPDKRVLIVDDNDAGRNTLSMKLTEWQMTVVAFGSCAEAASHLKQDANFDVALIDLSMPEQAAEKLMEYIRFELDLLDLPIVVLPLLGDGEIRSRIDELRIAAILAKPVKYSQLSNTFAGLFTIRKPALPHTYELPIDYVADNAPLQETRAGDAGLARADSQTQRPLQILVGEDNLFGQKVILHLLARLGYDAEVASDGMQVLAAVSQHKYDVILMDLHMPALNGLETAKEIRAHAGEWSQPYIIALTGSTRPVDRERSLEAGMNDFITKPIQAELLVEALNRARRHAIETDSAT